MTVEVDTGTESAMSPAQFIVQVASGYILSSALQVAARLGIADHLEGGPRAVSDLAAKTGVLEDPLYRVLRALASVGKTVAGDFFKEVPRGGDAYIMKHIIHDWDDERASQILTNIRKALEGKPHGKVILVESVIRPVNEPDSAKIIDLEMLAFPGGRERTAEEYAALFSKTGFELARSCRPNPRCP